jgi:hypothetical protein
MYTMPCKHQAFLRAVHVAMAEAPPLESARARGAGGGGGRADSQAPSGISGSQERVRFLQIADMHPVGKFTNDFCTTSTTQNDRPSGQIDAI